VHEADVSIYTERFFLGTGAASIKILDR